MSINDCLEEAQLISIDDFTDEEKVIVELLERNNLEAAIIMLSTYKGNNVYLFDLAYGKLIEFEMVYQFIHLYRTRSTVGDMRSKIVLPKKEFVQKVLQLAITQFLLDQANLVEAKRRRIKIDMIQALFHMTGKLRMFKEMLYMHKVFKVIPSNDITGEVVGYLQYRMLPATKSAEKADQITKIIALIREKFQL